MSYDPQKHHRRSVRLQGYDYAGGGAFFLTVCSFRKAPLFGIIAAGEIRLNAVGEIVRDEWYRSAAVRPEIILDAFTVMPNHIHGIVAIKGTGIENTSAATSVNDVGAQGLAPLQRPPKSLGSFVAGYKMAVTKRVNVLRGTPGAPVWQRNYYEHIIRNDHEADEIRLYIVNNVMTWDDDAENPDHVK